MKSEDKLYTNKVVVLVLVLEEIYNFVIDTISFEIIPRPTNFVLSFHDLKFIFYFFK